MTFDKTLPENTTKIRNGPSLQRSNFAAMQEADETFLPWAFNYADRTPIGGLNNNPDGISSAYIQYCKDDAAGNPEMFIVDENDNVTQMTKGTTSASTTGVTFLPGGILLAWGSDSFSGNETVDLTIAPYNFTTVYQAYVTVIKSTTSNQNAFVYDINNPAGKFKIQVTNTNNLSWMAIGV